MELGNLHKSSYSAGDAANCVYQGEVLGAPVVGVRDSKVGLGDDSPTVTTSAAAWSAFVGFAAQL